jgi:predicted urease superfamily metal-dependent hydrolase
MTILTKEQWEASIAETWSASIKATYQHLIDEAVKAEREACAKMCDALAVHPEYASEVTKLAAMAIRARSKA